MKSIQPTQTQITNNALEVEFYPSVDDYVHIALTVSSLVPVNSSTTYAYYLFLFLNAIVFPAFLFMYDYYLLGAGIFLIDLIALLFLIPRVNSNGYRKYYQNVYRNLESTRVKVLLTETGFHCVADGAQSFCAWRRVTSIEETVDSVFFYYEGSGFAVRKSGFAFREDSDRFVSFAREKLSESKNQNLGTV